MKLKLNVVLAGVALFGVLLSAAYLLQYHAPNNDPISIVIARVPVPYSGLLDVAEKQGFFAAEGLLVKFRKVDKGRAAIDAVLNGAADFGTSAETPIAQALVEGKPLKILANIFKSNSDPGIVALKDKGIAQASDLKGKRIGNVSGTASHYLLELFLAFHKVPLDAVTLVELRPEQIGAAVLSGQVDAAAIWNPHFSQLVEKLGINAQVFHTSEIYTLDFNLVTRANYLPQHRAAVDRLLRALFRAEAFIQSQRDEAISIVAKASGSELRSLQENWSSLAYEVSLNQSLLLATENEARWLVQRGTVEGGSMPDVLAAFEVEPLKALKPSAMGIVR